MAANRRSACARSANHSRLPAVSRFDGRTPAKKISAHARVVRQQLSAIAPNVVQGGGHVKDIRPCLQINQRLRVPANFRGDSRAGQPAGNESHRLRRKKVAAENVFLQPDSFRLAKCFSRAMSKDSRNPRGRYSQEEYSANTCAICAISRPSTVSAIPKKKIEAAVGCSEQRSSVLFRTYSCCS